MLKRKLINYTRMRFSAVGICQKMKIEQPDQIILFPKVVIHNPNQHSIVFVS